MVAVVGALEQVLAGVGDGAELAAAVGADDDVRDRVRADRRGKRPARARCGPRAPAAGAARSAARRRAGAAGRSPRRRWPARRVPAGEEAAPPSRRRPRGRDSHADGVAPCCRGGGGGRARPRRRTSPGTSSARRRSRRPARRRRRRRRRSRAPARPRRSPPASRKRVSSPSDCSSATLPRQAVDEPLGHGEQVAAAHVAGVGDAHLVVPVRDRPRAAPWRAAR